MRLHFNKIRNLITTFTILLLTGCSSMHWSNYYPYCKVNPDIIKKNQPANFEDCLLQIDTILSTEARTYFKNQDSTIAVIEICNYNKGIAGLFLNRWNLNNNGTSQGTTYQNEIRFKSTYPPIVLQKFEAKGLIDPRAMIRVIFNCYYKKINNLPYDWNMEIQKIKSYWINPEKIYYYSRESKEMESRENKILVNHHFESLGKKDTVNVLYNRAPRLTKKSPDWYYLTGIIEFKIPEREEINVQLIAIESEFGENFILTETDTIFVGDTLTDYCKGWLKKGEYYFNYHRNKEYRED